MSIGGGIVSYLVFPAMVKHMFSSNRGTEAIQNLGNGSNLPNRLAEFFEIVDQELFGSVFMYLLVIIVLLLLAALYSGECGRKNNAENDGNAQLWVKYAILIASQGIYFLVVAKMAAYISDRYMFPIYAVTYLTDLSLLLNLIKKWAPEKSCTLAACVLTALIAVSGMYNSSWESLYREDVATLNEIQNHADADCICVYGEKWQVQAIYLEAIQYKSVTYVQKDDEELLTRLTNEVNGPIVLCTVYLNDDQYRESMVERFLEESELSESTLIAEYFYTNVRSYYLS